MVMADRHYDDMKNGRRSRGGSPNDYSDGSSDELEHGEGRMRVGSDYQVKIPPFNPDYKPEQRNDAILVWAPCPLELPPIKVDEYVHIAKEKHGYNTEQALGMLFWHKHNVEKALADLPNFTPFPDEWTVEDKVLFEQAFSFHGKSFHRIRQMLPDKSIASLVKYYYSWKKTRSRTSLMDRQAKKLQSSRDIDSDEESDNSGSKKSDNEENSKENVKEEKGCSNCGVNLPQLHSTPKGSLCNSCYQYWRRTGVMRVVGHKRHEHGQHRHNPMKHKRKPPRGMYIQQEDLQKLVTGPVGQAEALIKSLDSELVSLKRLVQNNKQMLGLQKHKVGPGIDILRPPEAPPKINSRWTNEELLLALQGVRKYGRNFNAIAEVIGNKTEAHVRSFFINFRRRYNLDDVLAEYETEHGVQSVKDEDDEKEVEKMDVDAKELEILSTSSGSSPGLPSTTSTPPPLLKQPQGVTPSQKSQPRLLPTQQQRTILQQPPPLIKPTNTANTKASANA
ncbi:hypothetical protein ACJMK2_037130 [Sinanodonta woodiana]|uniref:REST corepressor 3 n=1 Tax=Sinanodonta woodiana TaxID=1069815 RepID=A0ABD3WJB7_SINWO